VRSLNHQCRSKYASLLMDNSSSEEFGVRLSNHRATVWHGPYQISQELESFRTPLLGRLPGRTEFRTYVGMMKETLSSRSRWRNVNEPHRNMWPRPRRLQDKLLSNARNMSHDRICGFLLAQLVDPSVANP
jgi:hypothetical protein